MNKRNKILKHIKFKAKLKNQLTLIKLSNELFKDSKPMSDLEQKAADKALEKSMSDKPTVEGMF